MRGVLAALCLLALPLMLGGTSSSPAFAGSDLRAPLPMPARDRHEQLLRWLALNPPPAIEAPVATPPTPAEASSSPMTRPLAPRLVIIIDDIGNNLQQGERSAGLPGPLNLAILPYTPHATHLATLGHAQGKEIMLHAPMENHQQLALGPGALTLGMDRSGFTEQLAESLDSVPFVRGVNNHMGSLMTEQAQQMHWTMGVLQERGLFFVDSRTSSNTVGARTAEAVGVPHLSRQVFLDHERDPLAIADAFERGLRIARQTGTAVLIGHPYPETLDLLEQRLPELEAEGISLVSAGQLIGQQQVAHKTP
ncbi:divergent polysaccharide deacetylase family protein [Aestuariirhabdus litorea]|uniref:Divergent polysaccharide deacetylase family protein n=1 Tax=Aestuariirhabdus litorea TaxID=2528527 RepID=A0A3P3VK49_9GAMM|nr:divergent polysaccharide deacetylase family protein [Aestuariirhabdus litorea]RRJ83102.1 divergent polysaccharide deacetylase family protein [Aestuariirhabdus litorea]RWW93259.1 divergent polysaccharide deacetylase family protein [Endozoicomonadaceae bacterium GTF-13]